MVIVAYNDATFRVCFASFQVISDGGLVAGFCLLGKRLLLDLSILNGVILESFPGFLSVSSISVSSLLGFRRLVFLSMRSTRPSHLLLLITY
jgi:hypothetical protein